MPRIGAVGATEADQITQVALMERIVALIQVFQVGDSFAGNAFPSGGVGNGQVDVETQQARQRQACHDYHDHVEKVEDVLGEPFAPGRVRHKGIPVGRVE